MEVFPPPKCPWAHTAHWWCGSQSSPVTQELGQRSEDQGVPLPHKFSNRFCSVIRSHICHNVFCEVVRKTKTFTTCSGWSSSIIIWMLVKSTWTNSKGEVTRIACRGALACAPLCWIYLSQLLMTFYIHIAMAGHENWSCNRDSVCCWPWCPFPYGTHSWPPLYGPWGLQTAYLLLALWPEYGDDRGNHDGAWISSTP